MIKVYVHATPEKVSRVVNSFGKTITKETGRWRIGVICGDRRTRDYCDADNNFVAETAAILKGVEFAIENSSEKIIEVYSSQQWTGVESKSNHANAYLDAIDNLAARHGVHIAHKFVVGKDNPAAKVSRTADDPPALAPAAAEKPAMTWAERRASRPPPPDFTAAELDEYIAVMHSENLSKSARKKRYVKMRDAAKRRLGREDITGDMMRQAASSRYFELLGGPGSEGNGATPCDAAPPSR